MVQPLLKSTVVSRARKLTLILKNQNLKNCSALGIPRRTDQRKTSGSHSSGSVRRS